MRPHRIAVIGTGPRGMMVIERLGARLTASPPATPVELYAIDAVEVGAGRVYRSDQPEWFLMNTVVGQISAFSGVPDDGPARPGAGPSFQQWWESAAAGCPGADGYAPRGVYGRYLRFVLDAVEAHLPDGVRMYRITAQVNDLTPDDGAYRLRLSDGTSVAVDRVVLTTGHSVPELAGQCRDLALFAAERPHLRYIAGDSPADMPLDALPPGTPVGVIGLGLSFYDVLAACTVGRGGEFVQNPDGSLRYRPSGRELVLFAGSRSGMPLPARGRNQKPSTYAYRPLLFTPSHILRGRERGAVDFRADVLPWLLAEVDLVYYRTALRNAQGDAAADRFTTAVARMAGVGSEGVVRVPDVRDVAVRFGVGELPALDLDALARPFGDRHFAHPKAFERALVTEVGRDLLMAEHGNVDSPVKAALDVLRDTRWVIRQIVDFGGLHPRSHRVDFLGWYVPRSAFLAAGPPLIRLRQVLALIECALLRVVGPDTRYEADPATGRFVVHSPRVAGSATEVDVLVDARIPNPDLPRDLSPLAQRLREQGIWTSYVNGAGAEAFDTGGVAVTGSPFHPRGRDGQVHGGLYVLGIPSEHTRWFMQVGSSRPGMWSDFVHDADAIAASALLPVAESTPTRRHDTASRLLTAAPSKGVEA
jgi:hypothetical protein